MITHANLCGDATTCVVSANTTCHMFWCLSRPFSLSFSMLEIALRHRPQTDFDDLHFIWRASTQRCAFEGFVVATSHLGESNPSKPIFLWAWIDFFKHNAQSIGSCVKCIISKILHRFQANIWHNSKTTIMLIVSGPSTHLTIPRWQTAAILENRWIAISTKPFDRFW